PTAASRRSSDALEREAVEDQRTARERDREGGRDRRAGERHSYGGAADGVRAALGGERELVPGAHGRLRDGLRARAAGAEGPDRLRNDRVAAGDHDSGIPPAAEQLRGDRAWATCSPARSAAQESGAPPEPARRARRRRRGRRDHGDQRDPSAAAAAPTSVVARFTPSLSSHRQPLTSRIGSWHTASPRSDRASHLGHAYIPCTVAPRTESATMPNTPAAVPVANPAAMLTVPRGATSCASPAMSAAPTTPPADPSTVIPPEVPRDTSAPVVISRGGTREKDPISGAQVSAVGAAAATPPRVSQVTLRTGRAGSCASARGARRGPGSGLAGNPKTTFRSRSARRREGSRRGVAGSLVLRQTSIRGRDIHTGAPCTRDNSFWRPFDVTHPHGVVVQLALEHAAGAEQARFHGADRNFQDAGDLVVRETLHIAQHHRLPKLFRELVDRPEHFVVYDPVEERSLG